jgi:hypothetical protein
MDDPTLDDGHRLNRYMIELLIAVRENDTAACHRIAQMPPEDTFPFVMVLAHQTYAFLTGAIGHDPLEDLKLQLTEMDLREVEDES